jgi:transmembrane sensor
MSDHTEPSGELLIRFLSGDCSAAEVAAIDAWAQASPEHQAAIDALRVLWQESARTLADSGADITAAWTRVRPRLVDARVPRVAHIVPQRATSGGRWPLVGIAAGMLVAIAGSALVIGHRPPVQPFREFVSAPASRVTVTLRDGTSLVLGPATRLRVPADFTDRRTVSLDGEALFTVVHDPRHPFTVETPRATIRDIGTTFSVHAYRDDAEERVAVAEGSVAIAATALGAHDLASIDSARHVTIERHVDVTPYLSWSQGALEFRRTPLTEAVRELARTYDLDIRIADSTLRDALVTGSFGGQPVDAVLAAVSYVVGGHAVRAGRIVEIRRGVVPIQHPARGANPPLRSAARSVP